MTKPLIIVESPTKIKTLKKFLGEKYEFESSYGHVRDLPEGQFGIDLENDFEPTYAPLPDKEKVIARLKALAKNCDRIILSPDPDREGEAIAWHIAALLPKGIPIERVSFNSITKEAVHEALANPREIDLSLVNAQQARRLLDRLVGYTISPLLNRRLRRGRTQTVSAGRVQSAALKLIVERERAIAAFIPQEYWNLSAFFLVNDVPKPFTSTLVAIDGMRLEKEIIEGKVEGRDYVRIANLEDATLHEEGIRQGGFAITRVERKEKKRNPEAPFITSTLQQEASRHFGYAPAKTMQIAQQLYEGLDLGSEGTEGLITYMRTDSVRVAPEAIAQARDLIVKRFGKDYLPEKARSFDVKKSAQDAHEAIRPTHLIHDPESVRPFLSHEQFNLYTLIWKRFVASQMNPAIYDTMSVDVMAGSRYLLRATGSALKFPGFLALYEEKKDDDEEREEKLLPPMKVGDVLALTHTTKEQSFTRPPPRFTEASLVKELEKSGIGRPSTYAAIMKKIQSRAYTERLQGRLKPTELGCLIVDMLDAHFKSIMDIRFTADMEDKLELIAAHKKEWKEVIRDFWSEFNPQLQEAEKNAIVPRVTTEHPCPKCGGQLQKIWFKSKYFLGCINYPTCDYTTTSEQMAFDKEEYDASFDWEQACPLCKSEMKLRFGRYGAFLGCTKYPECRGTVVIPKKGEAPAETGPQEVIPCPAEGCTGQLVRRRSRFGKYFYSCSEYPACDVIGNVPEDICTKFAGRPKTAYEKAAAKGKGKTSKAKASEGTAVAKKITKKATTTKKAASAKVTTTTKKKATAASEKATGEKTKKAAPKKAATKKVVKKTAPKLPE